MYNSRQIDFGKDNIQGPSGTWTYLINDSPLPGFKVALIGTHNIGAASIAAIPVMVIEMFKGFSSLCKRLWKRVYKP